MYILGFTVNIIIMSRC